MHVVGEAADGNEVIAEAARLQPDVILLDLAMPNLSGLDALPEVHRVAPNAQIIVFSGFASAAVADEVIALGAASYLEKGASPETIVATIAEAHARFQRRCRLGRAAEVVPEDDLVGANHHTGLSAVEADDVRRLVASEPADDVAGGARRQLAVTIEEPNDVVRPKLIAHGCVQDGVIALRTPPAANWIRERVADGRAELLASGNPAQPSAQ